MTTFGDLRSLAHRTPSRRHFQALLEAVHVAQAPPAQIEAEWVPYLEGALEGWPEDVRACGKELTKVLERKAVPWARLVRTLDYEKAHLTQGRVEALSSAAHLRHVTRLDLRASRIKWPQLGQLVAQAPFERLRSLALRKSSSSGIDKDTFPALMGSDMVAALEEIHVAGWWSFNSKWLKIALDALQGPQHLRVLDVSETKVSITGTRALLRRTDISGLRELRLADATADIAALWRAEHLTNLEVLDLSRTNIPFGNIPTIPEHLRGLRAWILGGCVNTDAAVRALTSPESYPNLRELDLRQCDLTGDRLETLARATCFEAVEALTLSYGSMESLRDLAHMRSWSGLRRLHLGRVPLSEGDWEVVRAAPFYPNLEELEIYLEDTNPRIRDPFADALPAGLTSLRTLLRGAEDLDAMLGALQDEQPLEELRCFQPRYSRDRLTPESVERLLAHPSTQTLRTLYLRVPSATPALAERMLRELPSLEQLALCDHDNAPYKELQPLADERGIDFMVYQR